nr:hypothetical protein [Tanacetum cinerariifolium]
MNNVKEFPKNYLHKRWLKNVKPSSFGRRRITGASDVVQSKVLELYQIFKSTIDCLVHDLDKLHIYKDKMKELLNQAKIDVPIVPKESSKAVMSAMLSVDKPNNVLIGNPNLSKVKGTGCFSRMKLVSKVTTKELANMRTCSVCGGKEGHNKRTCTNESASKKPKNQKPKGNDGILKKLDRVMANLEFHYVFVGAHVIFRPYRISDHSPSVLAIPTLVQNEDVAKAFISHYEIFLGQPGITHGFDTTNLFGTYLSANEAANMVRYVSNQEIKSVMFSMGNDKSPGLDGFTAAFFKSAWDIVGADVIDAVREFFTNGKLLRELNHTVIARIPKVNAPARVNDYRPISCCNVLLNALAKLLLIVLNIVLIDCGASRCDFKVDIQKAYDTVDWEFLRVALVGFGFHPSMVAWIMECVSTTSFLINISGSIHGYFKGKRGLCQGDPLSPYLFTLIMEVLTLMLHRRAYDLFLFSHGDVNSVMVIKEALEEFKDALGLTPSMPKSTVYFCNVLNHIKLAILYILPFKEGRLPVKYLRVLLVSSRLVFRDCKELIVKVQNRVNDWKNKSLSVAGRLQLIQSVMSSMHIYLASVFILLTRVLLDIEQIMHGFLWCQGSMRKGKAKDSWEVVCLPKKEGGLGESLWVRWIHTYKLKNRSFWDIPYRGNMTWGWRKILQLRPYVREFIWAGFNLSTKVSDLIYDGVWQWPIEWLGKYPQLVHVSVPNLREDAQDLLEWRDTNGSKKIFFVHYGWNSIRPRDNLVLWYDFVWFQNCIPRHAFNMWLIIKKRLKTQELLNRWDMVAGLAPICSLCEMQPDSHEHLFFDCVFSQQVWSHLKRFAMLIRSGSSLVSIMSSLLPVAKRKSSRSTIGKLVVAAAAYFVWQERNKRMLNKQKRTTKEVTDCAILSIRLKLLSCRFKKSKEGVEFIRLWDLPEAILR